MNLLPKIKKDYNYFQSRGVSIDVFNIFYLGVIWDDDPFYIKYKNCPVFPIYNILNELEGIAIRLNDGAKYLNFNFRKSQNLYGLNVAAKYILDSKFVYITEGFFDVLVPFSKGIRNVVGIFGNTISTDQALLLGSYTNNFVLVLDSDNAGIRGANKTEEILKKYIPSANITKINLFPYKDFADFLNAGKSIEDLHGR